MGGGSKIGVPTNKACRRENCAAGNAQQVITPEKQTKRKGDLGSHWLRATESSNDGLSMRRHREKIEAALAAGKHETDRRLSENAQFTITTPIYMYSVEFRCVRRCEMDIHVVLDY